VQVLGINAATRLTCGCDHPVHHPSSLVSHTYGYFRVRLISLWGVLTRMRG
jgi:hypothetical protein